MTKLSRLTHSFFIKALPNMGYIAFALLYRFWGFPGYTRLTWLAESDFPFFQGFFYAFQAQHIGDFFLGIWHIILFGVVTVGIMPAVSWALFGVLLIRDTFACATSMTFPCVLVGLTLLWTYVAAAMCHLGKFEEAEPDYEPSGYKIQREGDRITIEESGGYFYGGGWFSARNILLYLGRLFVVSTVGVVLFVIDCVKQK